MAEQKIVIHRSTTERPRWFASGGREYDLYWGGPGGWGWFVCDRASGALVEDGFWTLDDVRERFSVSD